jgi:hypothetical protein
LRWDKWRIVEFRERIIHIKNRVRENDRGKIRRRTRRRFAL